MGFLHLQSLMNDDFYVLITVQLATSQGTCQFSKISSPTSAEFTYPFCNGLTGAIISTEVQLMIC